MAQEGQAGCPSSQNWDEAELEPEATPSACRVHALNYCMTPLLPSEEKVVPWLTRT